jgi:FAD synthase
VKTTLYGRVDRPVAAIVGVWDPFMPEHRELCTTLAATARERSLSLVAIMLHPNPAALARRITDFPIYEDVQVRAWRLRSCGVDAVLALRMTRADADRGAEPFLDAVLARVPLAELWLGRGQTLGRGERGTPQTIAALAADRAVGTYLLPSAPHDLARSRYQALEQLGRGDLGGAIEQVGYPPVWKRPKSGVLSLPWPAGRYRAELLDHPGAAAQGRSVTVRLAMAAGHRTKLTWPDGATPYLAFIERQSDEWLGAAIPA